MNRRLLLISTCLALGANAPVFAVEETRGATAAAASTVGTDRISAVRVEGTQRIEPSTVVSYLDLGAGSTFSQEDIDRGLKNLFSTGFFADVKLVRQGNDLVVRVQENPIVNRVAFEGNSRIASADLEKEIELKGRSVYTRTKIQNDVKRILDIYRRSGRYSATVEPKVIPQDQNRVDIVYEIREGTVAHVKKITFVGNEVFSSRTLEKTIRTSRERWYNFFSDDDKYDHDRLLFDQELLRRMYVANGYADFQVKSAHAELSPDKEGFYLTFVVDEGPQYTLGSVKVESELKAREAPDLTSLLSTKTGDTYDATEVESSTDAITKELGNLGYAFVDIKPRLDRDREKRSIDLTYVIKPGPRVYVERINITGNVRTLDKVIRREFRLAEGDPYNSAKMTRSEQRLNNLGFFEKVELKNEQGSRPDRTVVNVDVKEKSTGEINLGAGFSTTDGALADIGMRESNFLGRGQEVRTRFTYAARRKEADFGFTEPYFLNRELAAGFDIYRSSTDFSREGSYDIDARGLRLRSAYALQEKLQHSVFYNLRTSDITDVEAGASAYIVGQMGKNTTSSVGQALTYDSRNNKFAPSSGSFAQISQEVAGLGGDSKFLKHEAKASYYYPITKKWVWSAMGSAGHVFGLSGENIRINDRFFIGGQTLRGFRNAGIGPRDTGTRDALGGNSYYTASTELQFPLGLPEELGFTGAVFFDAGSLWGTDDKGAGIADEKDLRTAAGVGVGWASPFGPIRLDFAYPISKGKSDRTENFRFSFGTRF